MSDTENTEVLGDTDDLDAFSGSFFGQKPAVTETKVEVEQDDESTDKTEVVEDQVTDPNVDPEAEYKEAPPKKKTVQDRIDELVKQREDAKRESAADMQKLRQEFEDYKKGATPADKTAAPAEPQPTDLKEDGSPKYDLGEFDPQYIRDLTRHTLAEERIRSDAVMAEQNRTRELQQAQATMQTSWNEKVETVTTQYPDFTEKGQELLRGFNDLPPDYAGYLSTVLMSMDKGPDVLYYLSNHPEEAVAIVNSGAQRATLALGRIEAKFLQTDEQKQATQTKVTKAPPPPPVRSRGTNGAFIAVAPDTDDLDAFSTAFFQKK